MIDGSVKGLGVVHITVQKPPGVNFICYLPHTEGRSIL